MNDRPLTLRFLLALVAAQAHYAGRRSLTGALLVRAAGLEASDARS